MVRRSSPWIASLPATMWPLVSMASSPSRSLMKPPHHQDTGRHVPGGEVAFPIAVEPASGDPGKVEGCGAEPAQSRDLLLDRRKFVAELREPAAAVMRQPTGDHRVGEVPPCGDAQPPIVEERTLAALAGIKLVGRRIVDHARDDRAFALEPDRDRELRNPVEEIGRAVERIDDPGVGFVAALPAAALLAQESVAGPRLRQFLVQDLLGPTVGRGDEIARPLQRDLQALDFAEIALEPARRLAGRLGHHIEGRGLGRHGGLPL